MTWTLISKDTFMPHPKIDTIPDIWKFPDSSQWYHYALSPGNLHKDYYNELGLFAGQANAEYAISRRICKNGIGFKNLKACEPVDIATTNGFSLEFDLRHEKGQ